MKKKIKYLELFTGILVATLALTGCSAANAHTAEDMGRSDVNTDTPNVSVFTKKIPTSLNNFKWQEKAKYYEDGHDDTVNNYTMIMNKDTHVIRMTGEYDLNSSKYWIDPSSNIYSYEESMDVWQKYPMKDLPNLSKFFSLEVDTFSKTGFSKSITKNMKLKTKSDSYVLTHTISNEDELDTLINSVAAEVSMTEINTMKHPKIATDRDMLENAGFTFDSAVIKATFTKRKELDSISYTLNGKVNDAINHGPVLITITKSNIDEYPDLVVPDDVTDNTKNAELSTSGAYIDADNNYGKILNK